jgi:hypothetical protein
VKMFHSRLFLLAVCFTCLFIRAFAASGANPLTVQGVLLDQNSAADAETRVVPEPSPHLEGGMLWAYTYKRAEALKPASQSAGYGIYTYDNKFLPFDAASSRKALAFLQTSKKEDDLRVEATGSMVGDHFHLESIKFLP